MLVQLASLKLGDKRDQKAKGASSFATIATKMAIQLRDATKYTVIQMPINKEASQRHTEELTMPGLKLNRWKSLLQCHLCQG